MSMAFDTLPFNEDSFMESEFLTLKENYNIKTVIETGTYHGITTEWLAQNFDNVETVEIIQKYFDIAKVRLLKYKNVNQYFGSSTELLHRILELVTDNTIIFLDSHWYKNPVIEELDIIRLSGLHPIIVIHDFFNPKHSEFGFDEYPEQGIKYEWNWVKPSIDAIYGEDGYNYYYNKEATGAKRGCVFVIPR